MKKMHTIWQKILLENIKLETFNETSGLKMDAGNVFLKNY